MWGLFYPYFTSQFRQSLVAVWDSAALDFTEGVLGVWEDLGLDACSIIYFLCGLEQITILHNCHRPSVR